MRGEAYEENDIRHSIIIQINVWMQWQTGHRWQTDYGWLPKAQLVRAVMDVDNKRSVILYENYIEGCGRSSNIGIYSIWYFTVFEKLKRRKLTILKQFSNTR